MLVVTTIPRSNRPLALGFLVLAGATALVGGACGSSSDSVFTGHGGRGDGDGGSSGGGPFPAGDAGTSSEEAGADGGCGPNLTGVLRDFKIEHSDFEGKIADDRGLVLPDLGADSKPVYASASSTPTTSGKASFDQWYRDVPGVNQRELFVLPLTRPDGGDRFVYDNQEFFPLDGKLFGNEGNSHNYHFTYELHTEFAYEGGEQFRFTGDDDLFVFINHKLAIDLGGVHGPQDATIDVDAQAAALGLEKSKVYPLDFFFAERHTSQSTFRVETTLKFVNCGAIVK